MSSRQVGFRSLQEAIDTTTPDGKLVFHLFGALAEFEKELIVERTQAGLKAARSRGHKGGRPAKIGAKNLGMAKKLMTDPANSVSEVCRSLQVSRATLYRSLGKGFSKEIGRT